MKDIKNLKIYQNVKRSMALVMAGFIFASGLCGCKKKDKNVDVSEQTVIETMLNSTNTKVDTLLPDVNDEVKYNASLMLLLEIFTKRDENGKINADLISQFKSKLDVDNMISDFNTYLDIIQQKAIAEGKLERISTTLPDELSNDRTILSTIETIVENIMSYSNEKNKSGVLSEFNKIYSLIVDEKELEVNGFKFKIKDLSFPSRAVANNLAEIAGVYSRYYITKDQYDKLDKRTNDQNNKAYMKQELEILSNLMPEVSETDIISLFSDKYKEAKTLFDGKVNMSDMTVKDLVNYLNMKYLESDKVSYKDETQVLGEYDEVKVNDLILAIEAVSEYNASHKDSPIRLSNLLVKNYKNTDTGKIDTIALDFVQFNSKELINSMNNLDSSNLVINPYYKNIKKFFKGDNFTHVNNGVSTDIVHSEVSDGAKFIGNVVVLYTVNKLPEVSFKENNVTIANENLEDSIQYIQNVLTGECRRIDGSEYVLTK